MQAHGDASTAFPTYFLSLLAVGVAAVKRGMFPPPFKEKSVIEISPPGRPRGATVARLTPEISPLKLPMSQEQPSCKKNGTDHSGGYQIRPMSWSLRSF